MRKNRFLWMIAPLVLIAVLAGCGAQVEQGREIEPEQAVMTPEPSPAPRFSLTDDGHPALMDTDATGAFRPKGLVSRAELCVAIRPMVSGLEAGEMMFSDADADNEAYPAASALYGAGLLPFGDDGRLYAGSAALRGELAELLSRLADSLGGDEAERVRAVADDVSNSVTGQGRPVTRAELALVLERLAGREPESDKLLLDGCLPRDVTTDWETWAYIADAVTAGDPPTPEPGLHRVDHWLYAAWDDGTMIVDMDWGVWTFGLNGRYTTGSEALDGYLAEVLEKSGANDMDTEEALKAVYLYVRHNYEYLVRPEDMTVEDVGALGWEYARAERFFRYGGGTCYGFAAAFGLLARVLGKEAYAVAAQVNEYYGPHGFVVIPEDGIDWLYDVELENTRPERHPDLALFHIQNHQVYHYWYETDWAVPPEEGAGESVSAEAAP